MNIDIRRVNNSRDSNPWVSWEHHIRGQTIVEYLLLLSFVALIALWVSDFVRNAFQRASPTLKQQVIERNLNTGIGFSGQGGQTLTEFLAIVVILVSIILVYTQLSLGYVIASYVRYTSFMAARTEAVSGPSQIYTQALIGDSSESRLRPAASIMAPEGGSYLTPQNRVRIGYEVLETAPLVKNLSPKILTRTAESPFQREPGALDPREFYDNE